MAVGGAPISQMFADEIGADGYGAERLGRGRPVPAAGREVGADAVATYTILYWQEVPSQIKAEDERDDVTPAA